MSTNFTYGFFAVDKYTADVYELTLDMEHLKELGRDPSDLPFDPTAVEDYAYLCENIEATAYGWIKAFVEKDPGACTDIVFDSPEGERRHEEWYRWLYQIKLGDYSVKIDKGDDLGDVWDDEVAFVFEVVESAYSLIPAGEYAYTAESGGLFSIWCNRVYDRNFEMDDWIGRAMWDLGTYMWELDPKNVGGWASNAVFLIAFREKAVDGKLSSTDLADAAYAIFGIEGFDSGAGFGIKDENGTYTIIGRGGDNRVFDVMDVKRDGDITEVYVQFYGDLTKTVSSYYVKYVFEKTDGEYPYRVVSVTTLDEGIRTPFGWSM